MMTENMQAKVAGNGNAWYSMNTLCMKVFSMFLHRVKWKKWDTDTALKPIPEMLMCV